jgi:ArsR family transcriptional regulator
MTKKAPFCHSDKTQIKKITNFLKIINDANRLKILCFLKNGEQCVCDICEKLDLAQNLASHHLKALKDLGLVQSKQLGRKFLYSSNKSQLNKYAELLNSFLTTNI